MSLPLGSFGVNMPGCRYQIEMNGEEPGSERVLRSEAGLLITEKHELRNPFILPIKAQFVTIKAIQ